MIEHDKRSTASTPLILERYAPVSASLEWRIGQAYWATRGNQAFLSNDVPHLITNDGMHAKRAANVLFASCAVAAGAGRLEDVIEVAELGAGLGLHAHLFLNHFRDRCAESGADFYDRLKFYASDRSHRMVSDIARLGILALHREHVVLGCVDAAEPARFVDLNDGTEHTLHSLRAVVHNYMLDALKFDVLLHSDGQWLQLQLQKRLDDREAACQATGMDAQQLCALAASEDEAEIARLLPLYERFDFDRAYMPVDILQIPFGEHLASFADMARGARAITHPADATAVYVNHSYGAVATSIAALDLLRSDGFVLFTDYGTTELGSAGEWYQRYAASRAMPINFALLHHLLHELSPRPLFVAVPEGDERAALHSRWISREHLPEVERVFRAEFAQSAFDALGDLVQRARAARERGAPEAAAALYTQAHDRYPENWYVLIEWAEFATHGLGDAALGLALAERAHSMNPVTSALVHNVYGEALYLTGRRDEALGAYLQALRIQPDDIRAYGNQATLYADDGRYREAILSISQAIASDAAGTLRQNLVARLNEILNQRDTVIPA